MEDNKNNLDSFIASESADTESVLVQSSDSSVIENNISNIDTSSLDKLVSNAEPEKHIVIDNTDSKHITDNQTANQSQISSISEAIAMPRPKLKKIKRLKIRPISDTPVAPQKVSPDADSSDNQNNDFLGDISNSATTDLIRVNDAQQISQETEFDNSYILEGLPPELDYVTGDNGEAIYPETGVMAYKKPALIALCCFLFGIFLGAIFFSTKTEEKHGLEDVILNPDVPQGRPRCGLTAREQACIFYIMNCYKQELTGRDFFKLAATLTGREEYMVETENLRYATIKIKPGAFAQLNIPALK